MLKTGALPQNFTSNATAPLVSWQMTHLTLCDDMYAGVITWVFFSAICFVFGFPACVAVLWELLQRHRKGTPNDVFTLNLTVMDLVFLFFVPPGLFNTLYWYNWPFEQFVFVFYSLNLSGRPLLMACICLDCYLAVVHPITYRARKSLIPRVLMAVGVWVAIFAFGTALLIDEYLFTSPVCCWPYVITLPIIGFCDFSILRTLKRCDPGGRNLHPQKKKALQIIVNSLVMTVIAYIPLMFIFSFRPLLAVSLDVYWCTVSIPTLILPTLASTVMPILYLGNLGKFDCTQPRCCKT